MLSPLRQSGLTNTFFLHVTEPGKLSGSEVNLAYEILNNIERIINGLISIPSVFIIQEALVHVRIEWFWIIIAISGICWVFVFSENFSERNLGFSLC